jgi:hypothetical protein
MGDPANPSQPESHAKLNPSHRTDVAKEPAPPKGKRGRKKGATVNKTQEIRAIASEMIKGGVRPRPSEIVEELWGRKRIKVSGPQVSMALKGTGMEFRPPRERQPEALLGTLPDPATAMSLISVEHLLLVREFIKKIGSLDKALAAVIAYRHLGMEGVRREAPS